MKRARPCLSLRGVQHPLAAAALGLWAVGASAAALTDGSIGPTQSLSGNFTVPQSLGSVRGANLFHSFTRFDVARGESAVFTTTNPGLRHVITRVTGGQASLIDGSLRLDAATGSQPAFWFINPSGVVVGEGARIDVPGGLHLSTATQLQMADGSSWDTRGGTSTLSVAAPEAFGLLGPGAAPLRWVGSNLTLQPGSTLQLAAGDVSVERAILFAPEGQLRVRATGSVTLLDGAQLQASVGRVAGSGSIALDASSLTLLSTSGAPTGLYTLAGESAGDVQGGGLALTVQGALQLQGNAEVVANNLSAHSVAGLRIRAASMTVDGGTGVASVGSFANGAGAGADLQIDVTGPVRFAPGGQAYAATAGSGASGALRLNADSLLLDGQDAFAFVGTQSLSSASGNAGPLQLQIGHQLVVLPGGLITSSTNSTGTAGALDILAGAMSLDANGTQALTGVQSFGAAPLHVHVAGALDVRNGASLSSVSDDLHAPQPLEVRAQSVHLEGGAFGASIHSRTSRTQPAAPVLVRAADQVTLGPAGQISSFSLGPGDAGDVHVQAQRVTLTGDVGAEAVTVISSTALLREAGRSGDVLIEAGQLRISATASVYADSLSDTGRAGTVTARADLIEIDGQGMATGLRSQAQGSAADAGRVIVQARQSLRIRDGGNITAGAFGQGNPGAIEVSAPDMLLDGQGALQTFTGIAGDVLFGAGAGAAVAVNAGTLRIRNGASISSSTFTASDAGSVRITADVLHVDGGDRSAATGISADSGAAGRAGDVKIAAGDITLDNEALISSSALATGRGGTIDIRSRTLTIDHAAGLFTVTAGPAAAGDIALTVSDALVLREGGGITANTGGSGPAGRITIQAGSFDASGFDTPSGFRTQVISRARPGSGGQPGSLMIDVRDQLALRDGAALSIANDATLADPKAVQPGTLTLRAGQVMVQDGTITAAAAGNADAGSIALTASGRLLLDRSEVRTSSVDGDGGSIALASSGPMQLRDTSVTSSVEGTRNGNGGDLTITAPALVLQSGFVQANTTAALARGGQVQVQVGLLVPDGNHLFVGGDRIQTFRAGTPGYNVIQAAAPDGVSGALDITLPQLDLSASLVGLSPRRFDPDSIRRDVCEVGGEGQDSSFTTPGRGAVREPAATPLRIDPVPRAADSRR
jgi:filamentous hemagglutinin family protein